MTEPFEIREARDEWELQQGSSRLTQVEGLHGQPKQKMLVALAILLGMDGEEEKIGRFLDAEGRGCLSSLLYRHKEDAPHSKDVRSRTIDKLGAEKHTKLHCLGIVVDALFFEGLNRGSLMTSSKAVKGYLAHKYRYTQHEVFSVLFLTNQHELIAHKELFRGTIDGAAVYPREIARDALSLDAAAVILAHNHPSGNPTPSPADKRLTARVKRALGLLDIRVLDHFVVGGNEVTSMAEVMANQGRAFADLGAEEDE